MSSRKQIIQVVSDTEPVGAALGDEWFQPTTNKLFKRMIYNGVVGWTEIPIAVNSATSLSFSGGNANQILVQTSSSRTGFINAPITSDTFLRWNGTSFEWSGIVASNIAGGATGSIPYQTAAGTTSFIGIGASGQVLTSNGTTATWTSPTSTTVQTVAQTSNSSYFLTFVDTNNAVATSENVFTTSSFTINPSTGFVGIGTSSPSVALDITGNQVWLRGYSLLPSYRALRYQGTASSPTSVTTGTILGSYDFLGYDGATPWSGASITAVVAGGITTNSMPASLVFSTNPGTTFSTDRMRINSSGTVQILSDATASSTTTGALQVIGGVGIGGNLYVGGGIFGTINGTVSTATNANNIATVQRTNNNDHFLTFVDSNNAASTAEVLYTTSSFTINPSTGALNLRSNRALFTASSVLSDNLVTISNRNFGISGSGPSALQVDYEINTAFGYEGSAIRVSAIPNSGVNGITSALRIVPGVTTTINTLFNGIKFDNTTTASTGTTNAIWAGTGYSNILSYNGTTVINGLGQVIGSRVLGAVSSATVASTIPTIQSNTNDDFFPTLVNSNNATATAESLVTTSSFSINPGTGRLTVQGSGALFTATAALTSELISISNRGFGGNANGNALHVNYEVNSGFSIEGSAIRVTTIANAGTNGTANAIRIIPGATAALVTFNGIKFDNTASVSTGTTNAIWAGTGYSNILSYNGTTVINGLGQVPASRVIGEVTSATVASTVPTIQSNTNDDFFPTLVNANNATATAESLVTTSSFSINPSNGKINSRGGALFTATAALTSDLVNISNRGFGINNSGINALQVDYELNTSFAFEGSAIRVNSIANVGNSGILNAFRAIPAVTPSGAAFNGIKFDNTASVSTGTVNAIWAGTGYNNILSYNGTTVINGLGQVIGSRVTGAVGSSTNIIGGTAGQLVYQSGVGTTAFAGPGTAGQLLQSNGTSAPSYVNTASVFVGNASNAVNAANATNIAGGAAGQIHIQSGAGATAFIPTGTAGQLLQAGTNTATFVNTSSLAVAVSGITTNIAGGATGSIPYQNAANSTRFIPIGTNGQVLTSNGTTATWATPAGGSTVETTARTTNADHFLTFVDSNNASATAETVYTTSSFFINPSNGAISVGGDINANTAIITGNNTNGWGRIVNASSATYFQSGSLNSGSATAQPFIFTNMYGAGERMRLDASGNLGIGTSNPLQRLSVRTAGRGTDGVIVDSAASGNPWFRIIPDAGAGAYNSIVQAGDALIAYSSGTVETGALSIAPWSAGTSGIRMLANGSVGIGAVSPSTTLEVNGDVTITDKIIHAGDTNTAIRFPANDTISFETAGSERMRIDSSGNMLIGAASIASNTSQLNLEGYNGVGGTGYHGFMYIKNTFGTATTPKKWFRLNSVGSIEIINDAYNAVLYTFTNGGDFTASGNVTAYSDARLKDNVAVIENATEKVSKLKGVTFNRIDKDNTSTRYAGVIAQDVESVLPEAVFSNETISHGEIKSVDYNGIVGLLIEAIKEQQTVIEAQNEKLNNFESKLLTIMSLLNKS